MQIKLRNGQEIQVDVIHKKVARITIRVHSDGVVRVTVPPGQSEADARRFAERHKVWIERRLKERVNHDPPGTVRLEGNVYSVEHREHHSAHVEQTAESLIVCGPSPEARQKAFDAWWRRRVLSICSKYIGKWYPVLKSIGVEEPQISVRKMRSLWGSCTPKTARIRFNYYLICAPSDEIEYVVLHELAHLLYPNHGYKFASFMSEHMPDWKERRTNLNQCACYIESF